MYCYKYVCAFCCYYWWVTDYWRERHDDGAGHYAGVRRETLLNGVSCIATHIVVSFIASSQR